MPYAGALWIAGAEVTCLLGAMEGGLGAACACGVLDLLRGCGARERPKGWLGVLDRLGGRGGCC